MDGFLPLLTPSDVSKDEEDHWNMEKTEPEAAQRGAVHPAGF
jgi:hypothetical protein